MGTPALQRWPALSALSRTNIDVFEGVHGSSGLRAAYPVAGRNLGHLMSESCRRHKRLLVERLRVGVATLRLVELPKLISDCATSGWSRPSAFADRQRSLVERPGVGVATLAVVEISRVVERERDPGMVGTEHFLADRQRSLVGRFGVSVATLVLVERSRVVERRRDLRVVRTERALSRDSPALACRAVRCRRSDPCCRRHGPGR
jgi:hypothetical protein